MENKMNFLAKTFVYSSIVLGIVSFTWAGFWYQPYVYKYGKFYTYEIVKITNKRVEYKFQTLDGNWHFGDIGRYDINNQEKKITKFKVKCAYDSIISHSYSFVFIDTTIQEDFSSFEYFLVNIISDKK